MYNFEMKILVMVTWQAAPACSVVSYIAGLSDGISHAFAFLVFTICL